VDTTRTTGGSSGGLEAVALDGAAFAQAEMGAVRSVSVSPPDISVLADARVGVTPTGPDHWRIEHVPRSVRDSSAGSMPDATKGPDVGAAYGSQTRDLHSFLKSAKFRVKNRIFHEANAWKSSCRLVKGVGETVTLPQETGHDV